MIILPAVDMRDGRCVRLLRGDYDRETIYGDSPGEMARRWVDMGAEYLHLVDLDGARDGAATQKDLVKEIARAVSIPVEIGGGIRERETIAEYVESGVERVIVGTRALEDPDWLATMCAEFPGRIVCGVDARDGKVAVRGWQSDSDVEALAFVEQRLNGIGLRAVIFTDIATDGTLAGPNIESTRAFCECSDAPVIASGGIGSIEHVSAVAALPVEGVIIGRALYTGDVDLPEAIGVGRAAGEKGCARG